MEIQKKYRFGCFQTSPHMIPIVKHELEGVDCEIDAVIDFLYGYSDRKTKMEATKNAVALGANALDLALNIGALKDHRYNDVLEELKEHVKIAESCVTKPIVEVCLLTDDELRAASEICVEAGATFVKISSGTAGGSSLRHILIIRKVVEGTGVKIKAGVSYPKDINAAAFVIAGCDRIGSRDSVQIV